MISSVVFGVEGRGSFPIDMLRYDSCFPAHESDSGEIEASLRPREGNVSRAIFLRGPREPTVARWASFGWKVTT